MIILLKNIIVITYLWFIPFIFRSKIKNNQRNLLFINTEQIGDLVISSSILQNNEYFANYDNVYWLIKNKYFELFKNYKGKVKIIPFNHNMFIYSFFYNLKFAKFLRSLSITEVYNISQSRGQINELLTHVTAAPFKYATNNSSAYIGIWFLNYWNKKYTSILFENLFNEYSKIDKLLDILTSKHKSIKSNIFLSEDTSFLNQSPYITISPYSSNIIKDWKIDKYINLASYLEKRDKVFIVCSPSQKKRAIKHFGFLHNVTITDINLSKVSRLILHSKIFIGNDSGLTHLAAMLGVKTIAIIGGGMYGIFFPIPNKNTNIKYFYFNTECFGCGWKCKYNLPYCTENVFVSEVLECIENWS